MLPATKRLWYQGLRRRCIAVTTALATATGLVAAGASPASATTSTAFSWTAESGQTIHVLMDKSPETDFIVSQLPAFTKLTGIHVIYEQFPDSVYHAKLATIAAARNSAWDKWVMEPIVDLQLETGSGWIQPVNKFIARDSAPNYDFNGIYPSLRAQASLNGNIYGVPDSIFAQVFYYRKDIFARLHLSVPKTYAQWLQVAATLQKELPTHGYHGVYPVGLRSDVDEGDAMLAGFLYGYGGQWLKNGKFDLLSKPSIDALTFFKNLMKYGPPGVANDGWEQIVPLFASGKLAMFSDDGVFYSDLVAPGSKVIGKVGVAPVPAGPAGSKPWVGGWDFAMNKYTAHPDATWLFMQWESSLKQAIGFQLAGGDSWRHAAWASPAVKVYLAKHQLSNWAAAIDDALFHGNPYWVAPILQAPAFRTIYSEQLGAVLDGSESPMKAMQVAEAEGNALLPTSS